MGRPGGYVSRRAFDKKFGADFLASVPTAPGVYRLFDADDVLIYVGKAKDLRRRLTQYRNAGRKKAHRKMRTIVREGVRLELEVTASEETALLLENALIRELRPRLNVEGAYSFLYPVVGLKRTQRHLHVAYSTMSEELASHGFRRFGCYRNRGITRAGFDALDRVLGWLGHVEGAPAQVPYTAWRRFRQIPEALDDELAGLLLGDSDALLQTAILGLVDKPAARRDATEVQAALRALKTFFDTEAVRFAHLRALTGADYIAQDDRDPADIRAGFAAGPSLSEAVAGQSQVAENTLDK